MSLQINNPLNINFARTYILLYEIYATDSGKRVRIIAAVRTYAATPIRCYIELLSDVPHSVYIDQAHDYMQAFSARTIAKPTLPETIRFLYDNRITEATEMVYDMIDSSTKEGLYVDYSFSLDTRGDRATQECDPSTLV